MAKNSTKAVDRIDRFHKTRKGRISFGVIEFIISYIFISLAINSGSVWQYIVAIILFIGAINNILRSFALSGVKTDGKRSAKKH